MGIPYAEVIGDPIAHSKSPLIHNFWLERLGIEAEYRRTRVVAEEFPAYIERRRDDQDWRGCNVTMPLKQAAFSFADEVQPGARDVRALNALYRAEDRLIGANTDVLGMLDVLPPEFFVLDHWPELCLIGAGGAARAVLAACRERGIQTILFNVREPARGTALLREFRFGGTAGDVDDEHNLTSCDLVVNASPLGMRGRELMPQRVLRLIETATSDALIVLDLVYDPVETDLLSAARRRGLRTVDGIDVLTAQARHAFRLFFAEDPPSGLAAELRELLTR